MAAVQVFDLPELREVILLHLPLRKLLLARRVCKSFNGSIIFTKKVRQALWLEPISTEPMQWESDTSRPMRGRNLGRWIAQGGQVVKPIANPFVPMQLGTCVTSLYARQWYSANHEGTFFDREENIAFDGGYPPCRFVFALDGSLSSPSKSQLRISTRRTLRHEAKSKGNWERMPITHPSLRNLHLSAPRLQVYSASDGEGIVDLDDFLSLALRLSRAEHADWWITVIGGEHWWMLNRTVDEIKGWEMLEILQVKDRELDRSSFLAAEIPQE